MDTPADVIAAGSGTLATLLGNELDPLFWRPARMLADPEWLAHLPFIHWLLAAMRPGAVVELHAETDDSCGGLCDAAAAARLDARCWLVAGRQEGERAGWRDEPPFDAPHGVLAQRPGAAPSPLRCSLDAALGCIGDGSVDLLLFAAARAPDAAGLALDCWWPKLSDRAVVLLRGTRDGAIGDGAALPEWLTLHPCFEFPHAGGLTVAGVGRKLPAPIGQLCSLADNAHVLAIRERFAQLGERWRLEGELRLLNESLDRQAERARTLAGARDAAEAAAREAHIMRARAAERAEAHRQAAAQAHAALDGLAEAAKAEQAQAQTEAARLRLEVARLHLDVAFWRREFDRANGKAWGLGIRLSADAKEHRTTLAVLRGERDELAAEAERLRARLQHPAREALSAVTGLVPPRLRFRVSRAGALVVAAITLRLRRRLAERAQLRRQLQLLAATPLFDAAWYGTHYPDVGDSGLDPGLHYLLFGTRELRDPGPDFDAKWYMLQNRDAMAPGEDPLLHYLQQGAAAGRTIRARGYVEPDDDSADAAAESAEPAAAVEPAPGNREIPVARSAPRRVVYVSGEPETPGHVYRVLRSVRAAEQTGAAATWLTLPEAAAARDAILAADIVVIWRTPWSPPLEEVIAWAREGGAKLVFDLDDLMLEPDLARADLLDALRTLRISEEDARSHYARMRHASNAAEFCLATTEELAWHFRTYAKPTVVLPNGFDEDTRLVSRRAARRRRREGGDGLLRIGYAGGTRTHQRDFAEVAGAAARVLRERPECRLVLFAYHRDQLPILDPVEYPALAGLEGQIEWRQSVPLPRLPEELARFDINLAPLEVGNPFCEAKSELKYFEAALVDVCTIASPTGPYRRAIAPGRTGLLAGTAAEWYDAITLLLDQPELRRRMARAAYLDVLWRFGPERRREIMASVLDQVLGGRGAARAFALDAQLAGHAAAPPRLPDCETLFEADRLGSAEVTVCVPLYNYAHHVEEALDSVLAQTLPVLDLVVVDDGSTDRSLAVALDWAQRHAARFNRIAVLRNTANCGLGLTRNSGFAAAETPFVLPLDADNRLLADCCETLLREAKRTGAAFVYPVIREFGESSGRFGFFRYAPARLIGVPYIDAMALVSVAAWAAVGGYGETRLGWEDYDFWCRMAEHGLMGHHAEGEPLAEYRVHGTSMLRAITEDPLNKRRVMAQIQQRHKWLSLVDAMRLANGHRARAEPRTEAGNIPD